LLGWKIGDHRCIDLIECIPLDYSYVVFRVKINKLLVLEVGRDIKNKNPMNSNNGTVVRGYCSSFFSLVPFPLARSTSLGCPSLFPAFLPFTIQLSSLVLNCLNEESTKGNGKRNGHVERINKG
jgi:hypothetical protein